MKLKIILFILTKNELFVNKKMIGKLEGFNLKLSVEMISRKKEIFFQNF